MKKLSEKEFIKRINKIFNGKYDTSKVNYVNSKTKVTLICPQHGEFEAKPNHLLGGHGCPHCANRYVTKEQFIEKARKVHGDKYDYSKVEYKNNSTKVCIICPQHGEFWQLPYSHLSGNGCSKCNGGIKFGLKDFIDKSNEIHNNFYDYSQVDYVNAKTKVKIICPKHGEFMQTPEQHLRGQGCPRCKSSRLENMVLTRLKSLDIRFIYQAHIGTLGLKTVDFYLPEYSAVIECQGEQHFTDVVFSSNLSSAEERIKLDEEKYRECYLNGLTVFYFTIPKYFKLKDTTINIPFYNDKKLYTQLDDLLIDVLKLPKEDKMDKWSEIRRKIFANLPNTIETNHGYQLKNRILFLYDSQYDNINRSEIIKYYRNRAIKVKFIDFQDNLNVCDLVSWLGNY